MAFLSYFLRFVAFVCISMAVIDTRLTFYGVGWKEALVLGEELGESGKASIAYVVQCIYIVLLGYTMTDYQRVRRWVGGMWPENPTYFQFCVQNWFCYIVSYVLTCVFNVVYFDNSLESVSAFALLALAMLPFIEYIRPRVHLGFLCLIMSNMFFKIVALDEFKWWVDWKLKMVLGIYSIIFPILLNLFHWFTWGNPNPIAGVDGDFEFIPVGPYENHAFFVRDNDGGFAGVTRVMAEGNHLLPGTMSYIRRVRRRGDGVEDPPTPPPRNPPPSDPKGKDKAESSCSLDPKSGPKDIAESSGTKCDDAGRINMEQPEQQTLLRSHNKMVIKISFLVIALAILGAVVPFGEGRI